MEIIPGVHTIEGLGIGRAYLYQEADRLTLIDTGLAGSAERVYGAIERTGRRLEDLKQIVITHYHNDHIGSLADIVERTDAQVLVHPVDAPVLRGEQPMPGPSGGGLWRLLAPLMERMVKQPEPARVDRELNDGDEVDLDGGAQVVHAPGHTMGSIALFLPKRRVLFAGDAVANLFGLRTPIGMYTEDQAQARDSIRKLAGLDFEVACFGHGKPMDRDASLAFRRLADKLG